jgi:hypothetical protein
LGSEDSAAHVQRIGQAMDKKSESLAYLRQNILQNECSKDERIFVGSQAKQLFEDHDFSTKSHSTDRRPWKEW